MMRTLNFFGFLLLHSSLWKRSALATPHGYFEDLRHLPNTTIIRQGNLDFLPDHDIGICHLVNYLGFSRANAVDCSDQKQAAKIYKELAATLLAIQHFNTGNGVVVPEIVGVPDRCPIRLTAEFQDSQYTPNVVVQSLTQQLVQDKPCAVVGARSSSSTGPSAILSGVYDLPQMSFTATSPELNDRFKFPLFSRVVPADDAAAKAAIRFLKNQLGSTHLAVVYINDSFGNHYNQAIQRQTDLYNITLRSFPVAFPPNDDDIRTQLLRVQATGIRHVFMVFFSDFIEPVMTQAIRLSIVGPEYFWMLGISTSYFNDIQLQPGSELAQALQGMGILPEFGAKPDSDGYHRFVHAWESLQTPDLDYFNSKMPTIRGEELCYQAPNDFFQSNDPGSTAHFAYDTVMALGLGACQAYFDNNNNGFDGSQHTQAIVANKFTGATGAVHLEEETGSRDPLKFQYAVLNVQPKIDPSTNLVSFETPEAIVLTPNEELTDWELVKRLPFVYQDGTAIPPPSLPTIDVEMNYIGKLAVLGYVSCALIVGLSLGFAAWTHINRQVRVVRASQPFFLIMVCTGTLILGSVIIPLSVDDENFSQEGTDVACMSIPWLSSVGFVTVFSALASKTWRVNQLHRNAMKFTRLQLTRVDVLGPFLLLATANIIVLACWTVMAPLRFVRIPDSGTDQWNRVVSSTGRCVHDEDDFGASIPYMIALGVVNLSAVLFANAQAYMARNIHTEYSESRYIALIMLVLLQSWLTGIPVVGLVYDIPRASYVVVVLIVTLTSTAILFLMFVPKITFARKYLREQENNRRNPRPKRRNEFGEDGSDDQGDTRSEDGLKVFRRSSTLDSIRNGSFRQSYQSVESLKNYLAQSDNRMVETSATQNSSQNHNELSGSFRSALSRGPSGNSSLRSSLQMSSRGSSKAFNPDPFMEPVREEFSKEMDSNPSLSTHDLGEAITKDAADVEQAQSERLSSTEECEWETALKALKIYIIQF